MTITLPELMDKAACEVDRVVAQLKKAPIPTPRIAVLLSKPIPNRSDEDNLHAVCLLAATALARLAAIEAVRDE